MGTKAAKAFANLLVLLGVLLLAVTLVGSYLTIWLHSEEWGWTAFMSLWAGVGSLTVGSLLREDI